MARFALVSFAALVALAGCGSSPPGRDVAGTVHARLDTRVVGGGVLLDHSRTSMWTSYTTLHELTTHLDPQTGRILDAEESVQTARRLTFYAGSPGNAEHTFVFCSKPRPDDDQTIVGAFVADEGNSTLAILDGPRFVSDGLRSHRLRDAGPTTFDGRPAHRIDDGDNHIQWYFQPDRQAVVASVTTYGGRRIEVRYRDVGHIPAGPTARAALRMSPHPGAYRGTSHVRDCPRTD